MKYLNVNITSDPNSITHSDLNFRSRRNSLHSQIKSIKYNRNNNNNYGNRFLPLNVRLQKIRKRNKLEQQYKNNNNIITKRLKLFNRLTSIKRYIASKAKLQENKKALALLKERKNKVAANLKLTPEGKVKLITKLRRNFSSLPTNMQRKILSLARSK